MAADSGFKNALTPCRIDLKEGMDLLSKEFPGIKTEPCVFAHRYSLPDEPGLSIDMASVMDMKDDRDQ